MTLRRRALTVLACAAALGSLLSGSASSVARAESQTPPGPAPSATTGPSGATTLSDLHTVSQWAYPTSQTVARAQPSATARAVGALRFLTSDNQAQVYIAVASETLASGQVWIEVELPGRPNGRTGWVPRSALGSLHGVRGYLLVNRSRLRATLFRDGRAVFSAPVGVGKASTPTPAGQFYVVEKLRSLRNPFYGPYALGTSAYAPTLSEWPGGGVVGIHGTNEPRFVPGTPSHGCIRMRNADITRLWRMITVGTPIDIV